MPYGPILFFNKILKSIETLMFAYNIVAELYP